MRDLSGGDGIRDDATVVWKREGKREGKQQREERETEQGSVGLDQPKVGPEYRTHALTHYLISRSNWPGG